MKHSSTRALYGYWNERRGARPAPERAEIDPTAIPRVLADTFLLGTDASGRLTFRLAGTRVCALFCRELKGEDFVALFDRGSRGRIDDLLNAVCDEPVATFSGVIAHLGDGAIAKLEVLLLPLRYRGRTDARILGALAPVNPPYWLGALPVASLSLGSLRQTGAIDTPVMASAHAPPNAGRIRHGLVVYDGGRP
jgi:hypothetical protein